MNLSTKQKILKSAKRFSSHDAYVYVFNKHKLGLYTDRIKNAAAKHEREVMSRLCEVRAKEMRNGLMRLQWESVAYRQRIGVAIALESLAKEIRTRKWDQETTNEIREHEIAVELPKK